MAPPSKIKALMALPNMPGRTLVNGETIAIDGSLSMQEQLATLGHLKGTEVVRSAWCVRCASGTHNRHFFGCVVFPTGFRGASTLRKCTNCHWTRDSIGCSFVEKKCHPTLDNELESSRHLALTPEPERTCDETLDSSFSDSVLRRAAPRPQDIQPISYINPNKARRAAAWLHGSSAYLMSLQDPASDPAEDPWNQEIGIATAILSWDTDSQISQQGGKEEQVRVEPNPPEQNLKDMGGMKEISDRLPQDETTDKILHALRTKKKIVIIAGAGISVSAGST